MDSNEFKIKHSDLIRELQGIEYDLKLIYAAIKEGDFEEIFKSVQNFSLGEIARDLKLLDYSDFIPDLSEAEYDFIEQIRVKRNYWCHQCYVDFMYLSSESMRQEKFSEISEKLECDEKKTFDLFCKLEDFRMTELKTYGRI